MEKISGKLFCQQPDRDVPRIKCGYPLPCPFHTVIVDLAAQAVTEPIESRVTSRARRALKEIASALGSTDPVKARQQAPNRGNRASKGKAGRS
jgi:hypothetical protein